MSSMPWAPRHGSGLVWSCESECVCVTCRCPASCSIDACVDVIFFLLLVARGELDLNDRGAGQSRGGADDEIDLLFPVPPWRAR